MILNLLPFVGGLMSVTLAVAVLFNSTGTSRELRWPFTLFATCVGIWSIGVSLFLVTSDPVLAGIFVPIYYVAAIGIIYGLLVFSIRYTGAHLGRFVERVAALPAIVLSAIVLTPGHFILGIDLEGMRSVDHAPALYILYALFFTVYAVISMALLWWNALKKKQHQRHGSVLAISLTICLLGGATFDLFLPLFGNYSLIELGPLFSFVMASAIFYAIARQGLFDLRWAAVRTAVYALTLGTLSGFYLVIVFLVFDQLLSQSSDLNQTLLNVALTLILALAFQPIKSFFDRLTHRLFYKDMYDADEFFDTFNKVLTSTTDLTTLLRRSATLIADTLRAEQAHFLIYESATRHITGGTDNFRSVPAKEYSTLPVDGGIMLLTQMTDSKLRRFFISRRLSIVMPLRRGGELIGFLSLGEHRTSGYTSRDIRLLETVTDELVIAIENALSVQEIRELNAHLEQRVNAATKELRTSNAQLQRLDEAKDEFMSMASHQLRTPLTSIKGYISMLMEGDVGAVTPEQKHLLREAFISSERMVRLISDFLNVSRLQTGKFVIEKRPVDLAKLVRNELESLEPNAAARGLKFIYEHSKKIPKLSLDENKIQQVVMNFSDNAIYYSKDGSTIAVTLKLVKGAVEFKVKDTGIGVPEAQQDQLFNKFFRATNARQQRPDGTGVGLFLAKKVIDAHDGDIIFTSKENRGSTFGFRLPLERLRAD